MTSLMDLGDSYAVAYLGCAQLQQVATGLGVLQKPLRELYIKARKPNNSQPLPQRQLTMTRDGIRMSFRATPSAPLEEEFYAIPNILLWDAVRFVLVQSSDKKDKRPRCAFEPLDNDYSRNKDNLFSPLDKKYKFIQQQHHGALFTCVLRRTKGVRALDVHAFLCTSDDEALGMVDALNTVHSSHTNEQGIENGIFSYSPFGKSTVRVSAGADLSAKYFAKTPPSVRRVHGNQLSLSSAEGSGMGAGGGGRSATSPQTHASGSVASHNSAARAGVTQGHSSRSAPFSALQSGRQQIPPHVRNVFASPPPPPPHAPDTSAHVSPQNDSYRQQNISQSPNSGQSNLLAKQSRVFHLSQEDLVGQRLQVRPGFEDFNIEGPQSREGAHTYGNVTPGGEVTYEYLGSIERNQRSARTPEASEPVRLRQKGEAHSPTNRHSVHDIAIGNQFSVFSAEASSVPDRKSPAAQPVVKETALQQALRLGQGYALQTSPRGEAPGSWAGDRGIEPSPASKRPFTVSPSQSAQLVRDLQQLHSKQQRDAQDHSARGPLMRPPKSPGYLEQPPNMAVYPKGSRQPPEQRDNRNGFGQRNYYAQEQHSESRREVEVKSGSGSGNDVSRSPPPPPRQKPVARVPPHLKTGVRVLPDNFSIPAQRPSPDTNSSGSSKSKNSNAVKTEKVKSGLFNFSKSSNLTSLPGEKPSTGSLPDKTSLGAQSVSKSKSSQQLSIPPHSDASSNWQFGGQLKGNAKAPSDAQNLSSSDGRMGEKLLMSKKKDAEIASVMQNLTLDHRDTPTLTPGAPSRMNFEKSLGYFP